MSNRLSNNQCTLPLQSGLARKEVVQGRWRRLWSEGEIVRWEETLVATNAGHTPLAGALIMHCM